MSIRFTIIATLVASSTACHDATSPHARLQLLVSGDTVAGTVSAKTPVVYRTGVKAGRQLAIYFDASSNVVLTALSASGAMVASLRGGRDLSSGQTQIVVLPRAAGDAMYDIEIAPSPNDARQESFRLFAIDVDPQPEHTSAAIAIGTIVQDAIDHPADVDEYTFTATAGQKLELYAQQLELGAPSGVVFAIQQDGTTNYIGGGSSSPSDGDLESQASGLITLPTSGRYRVVAQAQFGSPRYVGGYRFEIFAVDTMPEHAPASLAVGDTIANESIDHVGDVDVFTLAAAPGTEFNVFLDASGAPPHSVTAEIGDRYELTTAAAPGGSSLLQNASGRFAIPASGSTIRIRDASPGGGLYRGPYRLFAARIDHAPEGIAPVLAAGAPAVTAAIEVPGDIDEYSLTLTAPAKVNLQLTRGGDATGGGLQLQLTNPNAQYPATFYLFPPNTAVSSGNLDLGPGTYRIGVLGVSSRGDGYRGSYQLQLRTPNTAPESVPSRIAIGDTIRGESLEYADDVDTFILSVLPADTINIQLLTPGRSNPGIYCYLQDPVTNTRVGGCSPQTGRIAPEPGTYQLVVAALNGGAVVTQQGAYELIVERASARPEHHSPVIALGDTVRDESIDYPGDYDDFVLHGQPGGEIFATFTWVADGSMQYSSGAGALAILDSASGAILAGTPSYGGAETTQRATIPASGVVRIRTQGLRSMTGGYWFVVLPLNRAPETRSPAFALGDTVAEAIQPLVDIDEYTFDGTAGQSVDIFFQAPNGTSTSFNGLALDLIDVASGAVLATVITRDYTANLEDISQRGVVLPSTGSYLVRVHSVANGYTDGNYRFRIAPSP